MADITLTQGDISSGFDDCDEGVFEQGDGSPPHSHAEDDSLPPHVKIEKYAQLCNSHGRQLTWRVLVDLFKTGAPESVDMYLPLIMDVITKKLADEVDKLFRMDLLVQMPNLAAVAKECSSRIPTLENMCVEYLLPMLIKNLKTDDILVKRRTQSTLFSLIENGLLTVNDVETSVCPALLDLSKDQCMDHQVFSVMLMSKLAPLLGPEVTERTLLDRFSQLCSYQSPFDVKNVCASHFDEFCSVVGTAAYERVLFPCYIRLCEDEVWGVRKACADVAMSVSHACPPTLRRTTLAPVFTKLLQDPNRWVRMSAFHSLGPFISTFAEINSSHVYNNNGDLMFVNEDGREFHVTSRRYTMNDGFKDCYGEFIVRSLALNYDEPDEEGSNEDGWDYGDDRDVTIEIPASIDNDVEAVEVTDMEKKREDVIIQKSFNVVSKAMFGEVVVDKPMEVDGMGGDELEDALPKEDSDENLKEIVETVKNAVLSFRNADNKNEKDEGDENHCDTDCDSICTGTNSLNEIKMETDTTADAVDEKNLDINKNDDNIKQNKETADDFNQFNSYNYWYISPEMPVDLNIINEESPTKPSSYIVQTDHLSSLLSKLDLDSSCDSIKEYTLIEKDPKEINNEDDCDSELNVPRSLIDQYILMTNSKLAQTTDNEIAFHCAYSLPAVVLTLGRRNWHLLKSTVEVLAVDMQYKVRRTVASCLHELAIILGPEIASKDLAPIFDGFIKDLDEVRVGVLKHLAQFLGILNPTKRVVYLSCLPNFLQTDNEMNWRFRQEFADQLRQSVPLFRPNDIRKYMMPIAMLLLDDKVAAVRETTLAFITEIVKQLANDQAITHGLLLFNFAHAKKWKRRQTFALLCSHILSNDAITMESFVIDMMPHLLDLGWDPVANVRLVVARTISQHLINHAYFQDPANCQHKKGLETVLRRLQADKDRDVRDSAFGDDTSRSSPNVF